VNEVFDRYRGRFKIDTPEKYGNEFRAQAPDLRGGGRPAIAAEGVSHPAAPGQDAPVASFDVAACPCTDRTAEETPKEQAG
jgi:hypothetical protein